MLKIQTQDEIMKLPIDDRFTIRLNKNITDIKSNSQESTEACDELKAKFEALMKKWGIVESTDPTFTVGRVGPTVILTLQCTVSIA